MELTREQALDLLKEYNKEPFHLRHAYTVEAVMDWFTRELGYGIRRSSGPRRACSTTWTLSSIPKSTASRPGRSWRKRGWTRLSSTRW